MNKKTLILLGFILLKFILQFSIISSEYDLQRDEYLHLDLGNHMAWGYQSVPPVTALVSKLIYLLGNSVFWVKFFPAAFGAVTIVIVWKTIEELKGNLFALILGATCILFSCLLRLNTLFQPNSLDVLCWTASFFFIVKYFNSDKTKWLLIAALVFAFGFLNKYNILFLLMGLVPAILLTEQRKVFLQKKLYLALIVGVLVILPNIIWQYTNDFPVFKHLKELAETQLINVSIAGFLQSQLLFFIGALVVIIAALYALVSYEPFKKYRFLFWSFFITLAIFILLKAKDYYAIGLYPIYVAFGAVYLSDVLKNGWKKYLKPVLLILPIVFFIPMYMVGLPNKSPEYIVENSDVYKDLGSLRWEDGKDHLIPQDYADMLGWQELAQKVDAVYANIPNAAQTLILCDNYGQAGAINYYSKLGVKADSFSADYINWFSLEKPYVNLIRIKEFKEKDAEFKETSPYFEASILADSISNPYAREYKTMIFVFEGSKVKINERIKAEIDEVKGN